MSERTSTIVQFARSASPHKQNLGSIRKANQNAGPTNVKFVERALRRGGTSADISSYMKGRFVVMIAHSLLTPKVPFQLTEKCTMRIESSSALSVPRTLPQLRTCYDMRGSTLNSSRGLTGVTCAISPLAIFHFLGSTKRLM